MGLSQEWERRLLQIIFKRGGPTGSQPTGIYTSPFTICHSLHSADPTDDHAVALANELAATGSYARGLLNCDPDINTHVQWNAIDAPVAGAQRITNKATITFPTATATWNSGNPIGFVGFWRVTTAGTAGEYIGSTAINPSQIVLQGNTLRFQGGTPGFLSFSIS